MTKRARKKSPKKAPAAPGPFPYPHWIEWNEIDWKKHRRDETPERVRGLWLIQLPDDGRYEYFVPESDIGDLPPGTMVTRPDGTWYVIGASVGDVFSD
jgi:hypothetical protein